MILVFVVTFYLLPITFYFQFSPYKGKEYYRNKQTKRQLFSLLFFKGKLSCPYIKGHELQARTSVGVLPYIKGELLTYSAFADFAPTSAHANFSQTISDRLLLEGTSCKLAPAWGFALLGHELQARASEGVKGHELQARASVGQRGATFLSIKSKNMKAPRG